MRWLVVALIVLLLLLQYALWWGDGGLAGQNELKARIAEQQEINERLLKRNDEIAEEVEALRTEDGMEERARHDLGLIREGETFYLVNEPEQP